MWTAAPLDRIGELRAAASSGLMALTGRADGPPLAPPPGLVDGITQLATSLARWSADVGDAVDVDWAGLLTVRAELLGLTRRGRSSANGSCRLLRARDGWMAVNLPRPDDRVAVGALIEGDAGDDPWEALERMAAFAPVAGLVERARLLGLPAGPVGPATGVPAPWTTHRRWPSVGRRPLAGLRVVDLSSMWAGPLAGLLLARAGATVVKIESSTRPDGARATPAFYRTLHPDGQEVLTLDFAGRRGQARLRAHLEAADVVIESSRPRALEQLGLAPEMIAGRPGKIWLSITGYGRSRPGREWVAFGDDAAAAGGAVAWEDAQHPVFCGDALGDPVTGMTGALAVLQAVASGGGVLIDVAMAACVAALLRPDDRTPAARAERRDGAWWIVAGGRVPVHDRSLAFTGRGG